MKELSFYEQVGLVIPGSVLLFGLVILFPQLQQAASAQGITVGALGIFLIAAYALGHGVAAAGNLLEAVVWRCAGGLPSQWVCSPKGRLLSGDQLDRLEAKAVARLGMVAPLRGMAPDQWRATFGLLYRDVLSTAANQRIETFNGNYGLNRGLATACLLLSPIVLIWAPEERLWWSAGLVAAAMIFIARMCRFGIYFAREVYARFILLPDVRL